MKQSIILILILISFNCKTVEKVSEKNAKEYYKTGELKATGLIEEDFSKYSNYRKGLWKEFYKSGKQKESGNYKLDTYTNCCTGGICETYYSYKYGEWLYYHENGKLKAKGIYKIIKKHKKTSCEGGNKINYGVIDNSWKFFDLKGNKIEPTEKNISEIQKRSVLDSWDMTN
tara:strand:- start:92 stop:607 length:516 start_codon:yes stop_codon:yes gene_type:complete